MYKLLNDSQGNVICVLHISKGLYVPLDPANRDYQEYLAWLAEGNEPLPADEPE